MQLATFDVGAHSLNISSWWMPPWLLYRPRLQEAFLKILAKDVLNTMVSYYDNLYYLNEPIIDAVYQVTNSLELRNRLSYNDFYDLHPSETPIPRWLNPPIGPREEYQEHIR